MGCFKATAKNDGGTEKRSPHCDLYGPLQNGRRFTELGKILKVNCPVDMSD